MKKINLVKLGVFLSGLFIIIAALSLFSTALAAGGAIWAAVGAPVSGEPVTVENVKEGSPDLDMNYVSQKITEMRPASAPLDTIMRKITNQNVADSFRYDYYAVDTRPLYDTVKTTYTATGDGQLTYDLVVNNIGMWSADDTCVFRGIVGSDGLDLACFILSKNVTNTTIKIQPLNGLAGANTTAGEKILPASIPSTTRIVRMGAAKHELDAQTSPYAILPVKEFNYLQIFMAQVEQSTFQKIYKKEVNWNFSDYEAQNIYDMRATTELSYLLGFRAAFPDNILTKERYTTGGAIRFITKGLEYGLGGADRTIDNGTFIDWMESIFSGNSGADTRLLFGGSGLMANISKVDTVQKQIDAKQTEVQWGLTFNAISSNFGKLLFFRHPLLDQAGMTDYGFVLDINNIEKVTMKDKALSTRTLNLKESGQRNVDAVVIEETSGVIVRYPDTHAVIKPKA